MPTCREIAAQATNHVERNLSFAQRLQFRMHLAMCAVCRRYIWQMRQTSDVLRGFRRAGLIAKERARR